MENHGLLTDPTSRSFLGRFPVVKLILLWMGMVATLSSCGYYSAGTQVQGDSFMKHAAIESGILWAGLAVGIATCVSLGLLILSRVHVKGLRAGWAVFWLAISSAISAMVTYLVVELLANSMPQDWYVLTGERYEGRVLTWGWMIMIGGMCFVIFTAIVIFILHAGANRSPETQEGH